MGLLIPDLMGSGYKAGRLRKILGSLKKGFKVIQGDKYPEPNYITYQITGWIEETQLASTVERHFYHLHTNSELNEWEQQADNHTFKLFWSPINKLPEIVSPQNEWIKYVSNELKYTFPI